MPQLPINLGDTLTSLAQSQLGDWRQWRELADVNDLNRVGANEPSAANF